MGKCKYCGLSAGLLRDYHKECKEAYEYKELKFNQSVEKVICLTTDYIKDNIDRKEFKGELKSLASTVNINKEEMKEAFVKGWEKTLEDYLDDNILSKDEEDKLTNGADNLNLTQEDLNIRGAWLRAAMAGIVSDVIKGKKPERIKGEFEHPFNLQKSEFLIWVFPNTEYYIEKIKKEYVGGSDAMSIRIMKGVYYRKSAFRGQPVETSFLDKTDTGFLGITNKHIYFGGENTKSFRIRYDKIVTFTPYSDGIGICRDAQTAKPQIFVTHFGWFTYNLVKNLADNGI